MPSSELYFGRRPRNAVSVHVVGHVRRSRDHHLHPGISQRAQSYREFFVILAVHGLFLPIQAEPAATVTNLNLCASRRFKKAAPFAFQNVSTVRQPPLVMRFALTISYFPLACVVVVRPALAICVI